MKKRPNKAKVYLRVPTELKEGIFQKAEREKIRAGDLMRGILEAFLDTWNDLEKKEKEEKSFWKVVSYIMREEKNNCPPSIDKIKNGGYNNNKRRRNE